MTFEEYSELAKRTLNQSLNEHERLTMTALGLSGEAGECSEAIKKHVFHHHPLDRAAMRSELGDVLWYLAMLADACGLTLDEVAEYNVGKLRNRYPAGFSSHASLHRPPDTKG
jgi:NTP pyrophosphatase (non-canonical NTP hydrolase)